jgi:hypothetical protein
VHPSCQPAHAANLHGEVDHRGSPTGIEGLGAALEPDILTAVESDAVGGGACACGLVPKEHWVGAPGDLKLRLHMHKEAVGPGLLLHTVSASRYGRALTPYSVEYKVGREDACHGEICRAGTSLSGAG